MKPRKLIENCPGSMQCILCTCRTRKSKNYFLRLGLVGGVKPRKLIENCPGSTQRILCTCRTRKSKNYFLKIIFSMKFWSIDSSIYIEVLRLHFEVLLHLSSRLDKTTPVHQDNVIFFFQFSLQKFLELIWYCVYVWVRKRTEIATPFKKTLDTTTLSVL